MLRLDQRRPPTLPAPYRRFPIPEPETGQPGTAVAKSAPPAEPSPPVQTGSSAAAPSADSYFVQIKSERDEKAVKVDLKAASDTYKSVLNTVPLLTKSADLGEKGMWFRLLAGPVSSRDEATELCSKLKRAGLPACIVYKSE